MIQGAHGDNLALEELVVPSSYDQVPSAQLPSAVLELAELYVAYARDVAEATHTAPTFQDAVRMHKLIDAAMASTETGQFISLE